MLKNKKYLIKHLEWDTKMFKIKSAKIFLNEEISVYDLEQIQKYIKQNGYIFVSVENKNNNEYNNITIGNLKNIYLADVNIQFKKYITETKNYELDENIKIENEFEYNGDIIDISKNAFENSRFIYDKNLNDNKYNIYSEWAKNAFKKKDKYFCYYLDNDKIIGYILFSINNNEILLELIAVDSKNKGIGSKLIRRLEKFAIDKNIKVINVGTQLNNINAQNFYEKNGFRHLANNSIYHWWVKEN